MMTACGDSMSCRTKNATERRLDMSIDGDDQNDNQQNRNDLRRVIYERMAGENFQMFVGTVRTANPRISFIYGLNGT